MFKDKIKIIYRTIRDCWIDILHVVLGVIPKKNGLVLLTSWFQKRYADNTMYLYEYLLHEKGFNPVWITKDEHVYHHLSEQGMPVVKSGTIKGIITQLRAKCLVSTVQLSDYNPFFVTRCIFLDLDHGIPFKQAGYSIINSEVRYLIKHDTIVKKRMHFYLTATSYPCALMLSYIYNVPIDHILLSGKPRDDVFLQTDLLKINNDLNTLIQGKKTIVYLPTHRNCGKVPLRIEDNFDFNYINNLCKESNSVFLIKKHFYHKQETLDVSKYENIFDITGIDVDTQYLLYKSDALITDYSSVCPEYLLLDRPLILYPYDLEHFLEYDRDLFFNMKEITFVEKPKNKTEMNDCLLNVVNGIDRKSASRNKFKKLFFDERLNPNARECVTHWIKKLINDENYQFDWAPYEIEYLKDDAIRRFVIELKNTLKKRK